MSDGHRTIVGTLHVDPDAPNTIVDGDRVWTWPEPAPEGAEPRVLGDGWTSVGFTTEADISLDAIRTFFGVDPARGANDVAIAVTTVGCPVVAPVKRRGLTGKRYRIARRRYARQTRDYRRGLILPVRVSYTIPRARPVGVVETMQGLAARFSVIDETAGPPWYDISPQDAKSGYGGDHDNYPRP